MTDPIRVLHLRDSPWVDGPGRTILETGAHLDPRRIDYHIVAFVPDRQAEHPLVKAARERNLNAHQVVDRGGLDAQALQQILQLIRQFRIDVVHTSDFRSNLFGWRLRRLGCEVKLVSTAHGWIANSTRRRIVRLLDKVLLSRFDRVIAVSEATRSLLPRWVVRPSRTLMLHNALVLEKYGADAASVPRRQPDSSRPIVIANVGRLSPEKGQSLLLDAFARVAVDEPRLQLIFAGTGPLEAALRAQAEALGIGDRVRFLGFVADMPALYQDIDLVVQSSFTEGLPNVILEAAFLRVPIVATAVGGTAEVIRHRHSGWLIEAHSLEQLTSGIRSFLADPARFAAMGEAAHQRIVDNFSFQARTQRLTRFYEDLCGRADAAA
jgi:glycosyltransferase involved in cell wall biosynthesis